MDNLEKQEVREEQIDKIIEDINKSTDFVLEQTAVPMNRKQRRALQKYGHRKKQTEINPAVPIVIEKNVKQNMQKCLATALHELNRINEENGEQTNANKEN